MKKKNGWIVAAALIVLIAAGLIGARAYYGYVQGKKLALAEEYRFYRALRQEESRWLASQQLDNGAIPFRGTEQGEASVTPYFSDIAAAALLEDPAYFQQVAAYIRWHFEHINSAEEDKNGIAGTIYDYTIQVEQGCVTGERTDQSYDSIDSYAATFLMLLQRYHERTGDLTLIVEYQEQLTLIIQAMVYSFDQDGLCLAKPEYPIKYLMDNSEVYGGLGAAIALLATLEDAGVSQEAVQPEALIERRERLSRQIEGLLWNAPEQRYETGLDRHNQPLQYTGWTTFYPDATAQLYPVVFHVIDPGSNRAELLYGRLCETYRWEIFEHVDTDASSFYWGVLAYTAALQRDEGRVRTYMQTYRTRVAPDHAYPLYCADAGWVILACKHMEDDYEEQMKKVDPLNLVPMDEALLSKAAGQ